ncbi:helix-turn-helix domain-containing protein [Lutimonas zeaxanthinifaciens]|uniref:helix-turn-helix domain-containing protein n=1 Tax=Lutimonas zeaxanthinifaciens TaxID=3060215 RepID=UPI00265D58C8|nr:AraC family transcriptional regulator [Lutimonas sp. YSD2104]WKK65167.1 AraC family transcriptional regulator [Lutimonas sp. YSD2104]
MESVINTIVWAAILQGLLLGLQYIFSKRHRSLANRLLGFFLLCFVMEALSMWIPFSYIGDYSIGQYFDLPEVKLFFPVLFLHYVLEKIDTTKKYSRFLMFHYILAILISFLTVINFMIFIVNGNSLHDYFSWNAISTIFMTNQYYAFFLTVVVFVIAVVEVLHYKDEIKNQYSDLGMLEIRWLWQFIFSVTPIIVMWGLELLRIALGGSGMSIFVLWTWAFIILFIYFVSFIAFQQKNLFDGAPQLIIDKEPSVEKNEPEDNKDLKSMRKALEEEMNRNKYYLNQDLTLYDLSKEMGISSRALSNCINKEIGINFNEWVNNYRVDAALKMLEDPDKINFSIEGIGEDSGFKSRSAMYSAFKKKTGFSPGHYRRS